MPVYDDPKTDKVLVPTDDDLRQATGIGSGEEKVIGAKAHAGAAKDSLFNPNDRARKNNDPLSADALKAKEGVQAGGGKDGESSGGKFSSALNSAKNKLFGTTKRKAASVAGTGGIIGLLVGGGAFFTSLGPLQFIHASEILSKSHFSAQNDDSNNRTAKFLIYALAGRAATGRLSGINNLIADKMESKLNESGLKSVYSPGRTQRLIGYEIVDRDKASKFLSDMQRDGIDTNSSYVGKNSKGKDVTVTNGVNFGEEGYKTKRSITRTAVNATKLDKVSAAVGKRLLIKRGGVNFHPLKYAVRNKADKIAADKWDKEQRDAKAKAIEDGANGPSPAKEELKTKKENIKQSLNSAKGPLIAIITACVLHDFSKSIDAQNLDNQLTLVRMGMDVVNTGDQVKYGKDFSSEQLGALSANFYDPVSGTSWDQDPGIQQENGQDPTGRDYAVDAKPSKEKPGIFTLFDAGFLTPTCAVVNAPGAVINEIPGVEAATNFVMSLLGPLDPRVLLDKAKNYFATGIPDMAARGALRGGYMNIGAALAANDAWRASGARELTPAEAGQVKTTALAERKQELANANFYDKYLNMNTSTSLMSSVALQTPTSFAQVANSIAKFPSTISSMAMTLMGGKTVQAAAAPYDYGFPMYGFSEQEQNDTAYDDFSAKDEYMLTGDRLQRMNDTYGQECFNMKITSDIKLEYGESGDFTKIPDKCKDTSNVELTHYRFFLSDTINRLNLACYYGDEESCSQITGSAAPATAAATVGTPTTAPGGPIVIGDTSNLTCAVGTDKGIADGYADGTLHKIRICEVQGIVVNAQIATALDQLLNTARAAGVTMSGSGFRTMDQQISTRKANNCPDIYNAPSSSCSPPTARPGYSNHQMGLAIDFTQGGGIISASSTGFAWLKANAATYGLKNLPSESWHWSYNGN